ncbi:hypothetical protein ScPMuIL_016751 [Solemya velum]
MRDGYVQTQTLLESTQDGLYFNEFSMASFYVNYETVPGSEEVSYTVLGSFEYGSDEFAIQPLPDSMGRHEVFKPAQTLRNGGDFVMPADRVPLVDEMSDDERSKRDADSSNRQYWVELLLVVDYSLYKIWYDSSPGTTHKEKEESAKQAIRKFYAFVVNGVDLRYREIDVEDTELLLRPLLVGVYIADSPEASDWTRTTQRSDDLDRGQMDAETALYDFSGWLAANRGLPPHDHAIAFTAHNLVNADSDITSGIAFMASVCTTSSQSLVEDNFNFKVITSVTHELAHSLGADHDGSAGNCEGMDGHIMDSVIHSGASSTSSPRDFSYCSTRAFRIQIQLLDYFDVNCLEKLGDDHYSDTNGNQSAWKQEVVMTDLETQEAITLRDPDTICQTFTNSSDSYVCREYYPVNREATLQGIFPITGLVCGDKKWCVKKTCVEDQNAKEVDYDGCPLGDQPNSIYYSKRDKMVNCETFIKPLSWCYHKMIRQRCCKSCLDKKLSEVKGCEYGDSRPNCRMHRCNRFYPFSTRKGCCKTCQLFSKTDEIMTTVAPQTFVCKGDTPNHRYYQKCCKSCDYWANVWATRYKRLSALDCKYKDRTRYCCVFMCSRYKQQMLKGCCLTCAGKLYKSLKSSGGLFLETNTTCTDDPGVKFDGKTCTELTVADRSSCYNMTKKSACCDSCEKVKLDLIDCPYGDLSDSCTVDLCDIDLAEDRGLCCETKAAYYEWFCTPGYCVYYKSTSQATLSEGYIEYKL